MSTYVIVRPGGWGHVSDDPHAHLVVPVDEWVQVYHKEKAAYDAATQCPTYDAAHNERNRLNGTVADLPQPHVQTVPEAEGLGVQWLGERVS